MLTAHVLEALHASAGMGLDQRTVRRAFRYLDGVQRADGSFHTIWYRNFTMGTAAVLTAYGIYGSSDRLPARRARQWLLDRQLPDGA